MTNIITLYSGLEKKSIDKTWFYNCLFTMCTESTIIFYLWFKTLRAISSGVWDYLIIIKYGRLKLKVVFPFFPFFLLSLSSNTSRLKSSNKTGLCSSGHAVWLTYICGCLAKRSVKVPRPNPLCCCHIGFLVRLWDSLIRV